MPLQTGQTLLTKYHIDRTLGEGGFGYVYEATDMRLNRKVAIKELRAELVGNRDILDRFINEARAIAALNNPNIVMVLSFDSEGDRHYMILEFMDGGSLANLLAKRGKLSHGEAAIITKSVCDGLAAAHRLGIVHRDIKPANILMAKDGKVVKISDFGIAHVPSGLASQANLTRTGMTMGTPWYMSPEQARGEKVDARSDLYSVGVMLYEMTAGYMYLDFTSDFLRDVEKLKTTPPRPLPSSVPQGLQQIIATSLAKEPAQRFQSAEEMSATLQAFVTPGATIAIPSKTDAGRTRVRTRPPSGAPVAMLPFILGGVAIAVFVIVLLVVALAGRSTGSQPAVPTSVRTGAGVTERAPGALPTADRTAIALEVLATQTAVQATEAAIAAKFAATQTASAPTATRTFTPSPTSTPAPTTMPTTAPTRALFPIRLISPQEREVFKEENQAPFLEWGRATNGPLADNEFYRIQVYHTHPGESNCNLYTRDTMFQLPPSGKPPCNPNTWRFNTGDYIWRISLVIKVDNDVNHDIELVNSEGRLFKWNK